MNLLSEQELKDKLPLDIKVENVTLEGEPYFSVSYESKDLVLHKSGRMVPKFSFSSTNRDFKEALSNVLRSLNANDIGYDEKLKIFTK